MLEDERAKVLGVERLILETICFKFGVDVGLAGVVKIGKALGCESISYRLVFDSLRRPSRSCGPLFVADLRLFRPFTSGLSLMVVNKFMCRQAWRVAVDR